MTNGELISLLEINGKLVSKRCTERFISKIPGAMELLSAVPNDFETVSDKIRFIKYGGGYCDVCGVRTSMAASGSGFGKYCKLHFHEPKKGKVAHNRKHFDVEHAKALYESGLALTEVAEVVGTSNVTVKNRFNAVGFTIRTHAENQKMRAKRGFIKPRIKVDRTELVNLYVNHKTPMQALAEKYECHTETIRRFLYQEGVERFHRRSYIEHIIIEMLRIKSVLYKVGDKKVLKNLEIDILIGSLAIEINGMYTHSVLTGKKSRRYHNEKYTRCKEKGIRLLQFWENDIKNKPHIIASIIYNALGLTIEKIHARKCTVNEVDYDTANSFYVGNHMQGIVARNTKSVGLFFNNKLVSVIGYTQMADKTTINRFCSLIDHNVMGSFQKLLKHVPGDVIVTYSHNDISDGDLYKNAGFTCTAEYDADMWYTDYRDIYNRQKFMKAKLEKSLEFYDNDKSEVANMLDNGYDVIWKSGTKTWRLTRT